METARDVAKDAVTGAVAGVVATLVMDRLTTALYNAEPRRVRRLEDNLRGGTTAYGRAAERVAHAFGRDLSRRQRAWVGNGLHWALGMGAGGLYGILRRRVSHLDLARGLAFGVAWWLLVDEGATAALGLRPGPRVFPWQTHARGLAGQLAFGAVTNGAVRALSAAR